MFLNFPLLARPFDFISLIMTFKIFCWNCRGISNRSTMDRIRSTMAQINPNILCLLETKANTDRVHRFCDTLRNKWNWAAIPAFGLSGGILVLWNHLVGRVTPIATSRWALHLVISAVGSNWILTVIYNSQLISDHKFLWKQLSGMNSLNIPWLLCGDFNAISSYEDHRGGSFKNYAAKANIFSNFILDNSLIDLGFTGPRFTWCNGQDGMACCWARLDRFLANPSWFSTSQNFSNKHLAKTNSDHSPPSPYYL